MLGLEYLSDKVPGLVVNVIGIKDSSFLLIHQISDGSSDIALQDLLMEGFGLLLSQGDALLESQVILHGS